MNPKLNSTVSVVKISDSLLEFFKTNTRQQIHIRVKDDTIMNIVNALDGSKTIEELSREYTVKKEDLVKLLTLHDNNILNPTRINVIVIQEILASDNEKLRNTPLNDSCILLFNILNAFTLIFSFLTIFCH